jgi:hypothetical protein
MSACRPSSALAFKGAQGTTLAASHTNNFSGKGENTAIQRLHRHA